MADGFSLLGKPCGTCNFDGYIMGLSLCPDSPLTLEGVSILSNATPSSLLPNNLTTERSENDVPPAPQAPAVSNSNGVPPLPEPAPITRVVSTEEPSVSRGRDSLQQVMTFPIKDRLDGWPVALVDFNLSSAPSKNLKDDINFATVHNPPMQVLKIAETRRAGRELRELPTMLMMKKISMVVAKVQQKISNPL